MQVLPLLKEVTAYFMLRPFAPEVPFDLFPGTFPAKTFHITSDWHKVLHNKLISIPHIHPGDTVWWHPDLVHAVESHHGGLHPNSVVYIPAGPDCRINRLYSRRMRHSFALGTTPPDFPMNDFEVDFKDRATIDDLSTLGLQMVGLKEEVEEKHTSDVESSINHWSPQSSSEL